MCRKIYLQRIWKKRRWRIYKWKGTKINYDGSYVLKVDEVTENGIYERKLKIGLEQTSLIDRLKTIKPYEEITLNCDVVFNTNNTIKLVPVSLVDGSNK